MALPRWPSSWIRSYGSLQRVASFPRPALRDWLDDLSRRNRRACATCRPHAEPSLGGNGGRHCPSYVKGWDPTRRAWVERIYYAGAAENLWGPYTIGFLEWAGDQWTDQREPAFAAKEDWEHGSVYEPNLIFHDGKWKMWYVAGSNQENYLVQGYAESADGRTGWTKHAVFAPPEMKMFDFCVRQQTRSMPSSPASRSAKAHRRPILDCGGARPISHQPASPTGASQFRS